MQKGLCRKAELESTQLVDPKKEDSSRAKLRSGMVGKVEYVRCSIKKT